MIPFGDLIKWNAVRFAEVELEISDSLKSSFKEHEVLKDKNLVVGAELSNQESSIGDGNKALVAFSVNIFTPVLDEGLFKEADFKAIVDEWAESNGSRTEAVSYGNQIGRFIVFYPCVELPAAFEEPEEAPKEESEKAPNEEEPLEKELEEAPEDENGPENQANQ